jgi:hypothetical protein
MLAKSLNCGKTFRSSSALTDLAAVNKWLQCLGACAAPCAAPLPWHLRPPSESCLGMQPPASAADELAERLEADKKANSRAPKLLTVAIKSPAPGQAGASAASYQSGQSLSRSCQLRRASAEVVAAALAGQPTAATCLCCAALRRPGACSQGRPHAADRNEQQARVGL